MAHTVESLAKVTKKTTDEIIGILINAGIVNKTKDSEISADERKAIMQSVLKKKTVSNINVAKNYSTNVKVQVKEESKVISPSAKSDEAKKVIAALELGKQKDAKDKEQHDNLQNAMSTRVKQKQEEEIEKEKKDASIKLEKDEEEKRRQNILRKKEQNKKKPAAKNINNNFRPAYKGNINRKLKKKSKTKLSQRLQEEQDQHAFQKPVEKIVHEVKVPDMIKVSVLAQMMTTKIGEVLKVMMGMGVMATINDTIDQDTAMLVVEEMGHIAIIDKDETIEDTLVKKASNTGDPRPPVVTIMGHVDHGKTSLLDCIRKAKVANNEAGGITQHIGAYQVKSDSGLITFIDTPGHAAFSKMRKRGASATDIIILVVAADDGVMPQTIESIKHAKNSKVPIIVAINKIDKEGVNIDKVKQELSSHNVVSEDWGGDVIICPVSAHTGEGIDNLLNTITLTAEILELKAETNTLATGVVLEAKVDKGRGKIVNVLVQSGTIKKGDIVIAGLEYGKIKQIINDSGVILKNATASTPIEILGLSGVPESGDEVLVVESERKAREVASFRQTKYRENLLKKQQSEKMDNFLKKMEEGDVSTVNIMIKADVRGSAQALTEALEDLSTDEVRVKIVSSGVGAINNTDITLAQASGSLVLGFNVRADNVARRESLIQNVRIEYYSIIYNLIDDIRAIMNGLLKPTLSENIIGIADVKDVFRSQKLGDVAGCIVIEGAVRRDSPIRVLRDSVVIYEGELESLRRFKDSVAEVKSGTECGIGVAGYNDVQAGDQIEVFERIEVARSL